MKYKVLALLAASLLVPAASAKHPKIAKDLDTSKGGTVDVIVQYRNTPTDNHHRKVTSRGGKLKGRFQSLRAGHYSINVANLAELADDLDVTYISPDRAVQSTMDVAGPAVRADIALPYGWTGKGIAIAVVDSGISYHYDLSGSNILDNRIVYEENFVQGENDTADLYGHGTDVSGIAAGNGWWSSGSKAKITIRGLAVQANLINLRVLNRSGIGTDSAVIAAIDRAIQLKARYNIRVLNLSLGRAVRESYRTDPLCQAVERAWMAGIVVVVAAGNNGRDDSLGTQGYAPSTRRLTILM